MSSPPKEKVETKGGHLPAVKAGGMRIVQKHQVAAAATPEPPQKDDEEEYPRWTDGGKEREIGSRDYGEEERGGLGWYGKQGVPTKRKGISSYSNHHLAHGNKLPALLKQRGMGGVVMVVVDDECPPKAPVIVSGVVTKGDKDFTPAAAQVAHQKPQPGIPKLPPTQHINQHIHQPRK
eukprot:superscaffoldBa00002219_g13578